MDSKKFLLGTLAGGVAYFALGFIAYAILLEDFFAAHAGTATGVTKSEMQYWPLVLGNLSHAALLSFVFIRSGMAKSFVEGMKGGAIIGFLLAFGIDMVMYDTTNLMDMTAALTDAATYTVISAIAGGVVSIVVGTAKSVATA